MPRTMVARIESKTPSETAQSFDLNAAFFFAPALVQLSFFFFPQMFAAMAPDLARFRPRPGGR